MDNLPLFTSATAVDGADSCALPTSTHVASLADFVTCMKEYQGGSDSETETETESGSGTEGTGTEGTEGTGTEGTGSTADCSCYANLLKTFGTILVMAILLNFLN